MKNYLRKLAFIAFFGMILSGCEKDLYEDTLQQQNLKYTYLTGKEALDITNLLAQKMGENKTISARGLDLIDYGIIKYDVVMKVVDSLGNKTFTFRVEHPDTTYKKFYNMVLQQKIDGLTMVKFYEYNMTPQFAEKYNKGEKEMKDFQGTYNYRLANFTYDIREGGGDDSGGGSGGGGSTGSGGDDGNIGGGPSGGGSSGGGGGPPCSGNDGSIGGGGSGSGSGGDGGGGSSGGGSGGGSGSGGGTGGGGSASNCTTTTITVLCNGGGGHTGESTCTGSNHGYSISITICNDNGNRGINDADPCGGSGGAGGNSSGTGVLPPPIVPPTPCEQLVQKSNETVFKNKLMQLKSPNNLALDHEMGFVETRNTSPNPVSYINVTNIPGTTSLTIPTDMLGYVHSHNDLHSNPDGSTVPTVKMLSPPDLQALVIAAQNYAGNQGLTSNSTYGMMVSSDGVFAIKMLTQDIDLSYMEWNKFLLDYRDESDELYKNDNLNSSNVQKMFLRFLKKYAIDANVGLFKATNNDATQWSRITLNPDGTLTETPC
jgi:hypothetical protein